jgi:hypothetical protein
MDGSAMNPMRSRQVAHDEHFHDVGLNHSTTLEVANVLIIDISSDLLIGDIFANCQFSFSLYACHARGADEISVRLLEFTFLIISVTKIFNVVLKCELIYIEFSLINKIILVVVFCWDR